MTPGGGALASAVVEGIAGGALLGLAVLSGVVPVWWNNSWQSCAGEAMDSGARTVVCLALL